jgi:hypothetical protein
MSFQGSPITRQGAAETAMVAQQPTVPNEKVQEFQNTLKVCFDLS